MQLTRLFLTICALTLAFQTQASAALSCNPERVPPGVSGQESQALIDEAASPQAEICRKIQIYNYLMNEFPLDFVRQNLFFKFLQLEKDAGLAKKAVQTYMEWPWQSKYSPWSYLSADDEPAARLMLFQVFQSTIPSSPALCIQNPLTAQCDEGQGLANYDRQFAARFPDSPLIPQMQEAVRPFYQFKFQKEFARVQNLQKIYEADFHPRSPWNRLAEAWQKTPSTTIALRKCRLGIDGGKNDCFIVLQQNQLSALLLQLLRTESLAHSQDREKLGSWIYKYALEMQALLSAHPEVKNDIAPDLRVVDWKKLARTHAR